MRNLFSFLSILSLALLICLSLCIREPDQFTINLDLKANERYKQLAIAKASHIIKFLDYLKTVPKYQKSFKIAKKITYFLPHFVGRQFYDECLSIAKNVNRPISELIIFNYMYQLGAYKNFCTSIPVQISKNDYFLARNLDYGYQQYLSNNSVKLTYIKNGRKLYQTIGHAGLIGAHTAIKFGAFSVTLNERISQSLSTNIKQIFFHRSETVPYLVQKVLRGCESIQQAERILSTSRICSSVYYILNSQGRNIVIERDPSGAKAIFQNSNYMVQTNTDRQLPDSDNRRTVAQAKMLEYSKNGNITRSNVWKILGESPNKNKLTLMTIMMDTSNSSLNAMIWD